MIKVLTPSGFSEFGGIQRSVDDAITISVDGVALTCSENHIVKHGGVFKKAKELTASSKVGAIQLFELTNVKLRNEYFTNGVVSHNCEFSGSSGTLISGACLKTLFPSQPVKLMSGYGCSIYEEPVEGHRYFIVVDVSRGKGLDYSAFQIIDTTSVPYKQVCAFRNNMITPTDYAGFIHRFAMHYNEAYVLVEINDIGGQVSDLLYDDFEYENVLSTESHGRAGKRISGGFGKAVDRGIRTTKTVKAVGCSMLKLLIEQKKLLINDKETISELNTFSAKAKSYEAEQGKHDDLVMGLVLFAWLSQDTFFNEINDDNILQHLRDRTAQEMDDDMVPFGIRFDAADDYDNAPLVRMDGGWWSQSSF